MVAVSYHGDQIIKSQPDWLIFLIEIFYYRRYERGYSWFFKDTLTRNKFMIGVSLNKLL